jgi:hypothetical protein
MMKARLRLRSCIVLYVNSICCLHALQSGDSAHKVEEPSEIVITTVAVPQYTLSSQADLRKTIYEDERVSISIP